MLVPISYDRAMRPAEPTPRENLSRQLVESDLFAAEELIARAELPPSGNISGRKLVITFAGAFDFQVGQSATWVDP